MHTILRCILATSTITTASLGLTAQTTQQAIDAESDVLPPFRPKPGVPYVGINIPNPIAPQDVEHYVRILGLGETQTKIAWVFYGRHAKDDNVLRWKEVAPLFDRSAIIAAKRDMTSNPATAAEFAKLMSARDRVVRQLIAGEEAFFAQFDPLLHEGQRELLNLVFMHRERARYRAVPCQYPGAQVDLSQVVSEIDWDTDEQLALEKIEVVGAFHEYERELTRLWREHYRLVLKWMVEETSLCAEAVSTKAIAKQEAFRDRLLVMNGKTINLGRRIHDLNVKISEQLASVLPPETHKRIIVEFRQRAYPCVYPDPFDFEPLSRQYMNVTSLSEDQRHGIAALIEGRRSAAQQISKKMVERYLQRMDFFLVDKGNRPDAHEAYKQDMTLLQEQRGANAEAAISEVNSLLTAEQLQDVAAAIKAFQKAVASHKPRETGIDFRP